MYINTLIIQDVLAKPAWKDKLTKDLVQQFKFENQNLEMAIKEKLEEEEIL